MPLPTVPKSFADLEEAEDIFWSPDTLFGNNTSDQPGSSHQSCTKSEVIKRVDYKNSKRLGKALLILQSHNVFHAKHIPQSHTQIV